MRDIIVIGAGGGGAVVAKELAERGLDVLLLEAGARSADPEQDFTHFENDQNNPLTGRLRFGPGDRTRPSWARELPQPSTILQSAGVGGTTLAYFGNCPRAMPGVFAGYDGADAGTYDWQHQFPFSYSELLPYYEWVEQTLPVQTAAMGTKEEAFYRGATQLGLPHQISKDVSGAAFRPQENAILQPKGRAGKTADPMQLVYPQVKGCTFCGHCYQGCMQPLGSPRNLKAKRSTDTSYVPMALTADQWSMQGRAMTLVSDAFVTRIDTDELGEARSVTWRDGHAGDLVTEEARVIVMACGAIETPRLWLNSQLPNPNDWVGRGMTNHYFDVLVGLMPVDIGSSLGAGSTVRVDYPGYGMLENLQFGPSQAGIILGFSEAGISPYYDNGFTGGMQGADGLGRLVGTHLKDIMADIDRLMFVLVSADDDVEAQNRVVPSQHVDEHGAIARVEVASRLRSTRTLANRNYLAARAVDLLRGAGAIRVHRVATPPILLHLQSSMRMGSDEATSVLDENGESRWVKRLYIADSSALANGLGGPNPTLTNQALATRTAEKIFRKYFGGDPWVNTESPMSSIDPMVTNAVIQQGL